MVLSENLRPKLDKSVDKILLAHRNTKLFLGMMTGPFFLLIKVIEYLGKAVFFLWLYNKSKRDEKKQQREAASQ